MHSPLRVLFLGNHTVGVRTLASLLRNATVVGVIAHPQDPEDGVRYESVYESARAAGLDAIRATGRSTEALEFAKRMTPNLLWVTDYRYLLPEELLAVSSSGAINLHPSLLPFYRGRASINWAILRGETRLGLTAHYIDGGMDTGDVIAQESYELTEEEDVGDALRKLYPIYERLTDHVMRELTAGSIRRIPQDHAMATEFPRRRPEDGAIDWTMSTTAIRNLIRAVAKPYPGAFTSFAGVKLTIWKAQRCSLTTARSSAGAIIALEDGIPVVATSDGSLRLLDVELENDMPPVWTVGARLGDFTN